MWCAECKFPISPGSLKINKNCVQWLGFGRIRKFSVARIYRWKLTWKIVHPWPKNVRCRVKNIGRDRFAVPLIRMLLYDVTFTRTVARGRRRLCWFANNKGARSNLVATGSLVVALFLNSSFLLQLFSGAYAGTEKLGIEMFSLHSFSKLKV